MPFVTFEIPVELNTTVYECHERCDGYDCPYNGGYGKSRCSDKKHCGYYYTGVPFSLCMKDRVNKDIFLKEEDAQKWVEKKTEKYRKKQEQEYKKFWMS